MREVSQEEFDKFFARQRAKEIDQIISHGRILPNPSNIFETQFETKVETLIEEDTYFLGSPMGHLRKIGLYCPTSDGQVGSKYLVHYEDLMGIDL